MKHIHLPDRYLKACIKGDSDRPAGHIYRNLAFSGFLRRDGKFGHYVHEVVVYVANMEAGSLLAFGYVSGDLQYLRAQIGEDVVQGAHLVAPLQEVQRSAIQYTTLILN